MVFQGQFLMAGKACFCLRRRQDRFDDAVAHRDGMVFEHRARGLDRHYPAGAEEERRRRYLGEPWISTTTRRLGARHSISALRSFWSGQDFDGRVLPNPNVSTLSGLAPLETR